MQPAPAPSAISYVDVRDGGYWVAGTRVSLDSLVYAYWNGQPAESIAQSFPTLSLEQVYGGIAFYLAHRDEVEAYLARRRTDYEQARERARERDPAFHARLAAAKRQS